jgi:endoglucanase
MNSRINLIIVIISLFFPAFIRAQQTSKFIIVDQFGYLPDSKKIAILKDPRTGFDAGESFTPGLTYSVVNATTGDKVYTANPTVWGNGDIDASSGDRAWHFDFTSVTETGTYYILDEEQNLKSYHFIISPNVYNEILKQAMRSFFYQRVGFKKEAQYAGEGWADNASHIGNLQDKNCRSFFDKTNPETEKDVSGGWYDAGDYNKYTNWTANYVVELMKAYIEKPEAWADDYNIPESGNEIPDILDEAKWGIDHLLRLQQPDGSVLCIVGESHASPPSAATGPSYYGPASTSATLNTGAAFAISSKIYRSINMNEYADTLLSRAIKAWEWAEANPAVIFNNNSSSNNSTGLGAGNQEVDNYGRDMIKLEAACYLFEVTGDVLYRDYFDSHYTSCHLIQWNFAYPFEALNQEVLLYYTTLSEGTASVQNNIKNVYKNAVVNGSDNLAAYENNKDPYLAYMKDYTWGSNSVKSAQGNMYMDLITYTVDETSAATAKNAALTFVNYIHGVNPLNFVYLSNMYKYGAENGVNEFYHSWFCNQSPKWDRVGVSTYGPPPGYLTGGPNPSYNWDGCCPSGCGSSSNNAICTSESISPPKDQPKQKSYKDFNTSWPLNSWEVTENSCGYQVNYIRLLSKFVTAGLDCNGDMNGTAFIDSCGVCAGGNTGVTPVLDKDECSVPLDCNGDMNGTAFIDSCGICAGGNTGITPVLDTNLCPAPIDCHGDRWGTAFVDSCGICAGGNTGITPVLDTNLCPAPIDCHGDRWGNAFVDSCGVCAGGNTGITPVLDTNLCPAPIDCHGDRWGNAFVDSCGICAGGNTGMIPILDILECQNTSLSKFTYSKLPEFNIYPNPNNGLLHIDCSEQIPIETVIVDLVGKVLLNKIFTGNAIFDIGNLNPGYYEIIIKIQDQIIRRKLILN